jgi:hypothetical protein
MTRILLSFGALAALALAACQARFGNEVAEAANESGNASAAGKAEEGRVSIHAPGFDMKVNIPKGLRREAGMESDSGIFYPNATFGGMHIEGGREEAGGHSNGEVELSFETADAPDLVAHWYQDPARAPEFTVVSTRRDGADYLFAGTAGNDHGPFRVRLTPRQGGGTEGRVVLTDND